MPRPQRLQAQGLWLHGCPAARRTLQSRWFLHVFGTRVSHHTICVRQNGVLLGQRSELSLLCCNKVLLAKSPTLHTATNGSEPGASKKRQHYFVHNKLSNGTILLNEPSNYTSTMCFAGLVHGKAEANSMDDTVAAGNVNGLSNLENKNANCE